MVALVVLVASAFLVVLLRFYIRIQMKAGVAWDDWWILIGLLMAVLSAGLLLWGMWFFFPTYPRTRHYLLPKLTVLSPPKSWPYGLNSRWGDQEGHRK